MENALQKALERIAALEHRVAMLEARPIASPVLPGVQMPNITLPGPSYLDRTSISTVGTVTCQNLKPGASFNA